MNNDFESNMALVVDIYNKRFSHLSWLKDDLLQCGYMGLFKACKTFDPTKGCQFSTYAARCIINSILMFLRKENKHINFDTNFEINFDEGEEIPILDLLQSSDDLERGLDLRNFIKHSKNRKIVELYVDGFTIKEISEKFQISRNCVSRKIKKELQNYKKYLEE